MLPARVTRDRVCFSFSDLITLSVLWEKGKEEGSKRLGACWLAEKEVAREKELPDHRPKGRQKKEERGVEIKLISAGRVTDDVRVRKASSVVDVTLQKESSISIW